MPNERQQKFIKFVAHGESPYQACLKAGYSKKYAKNFSHKLLEKYGNEIKNLKSKAQKVIEEEFSYSVKDSFDKLVELQNIALSCFDKNGNPNINAAIKAEELKGRIFGVYEKDNNQKQNGINIVVADEKHQKMLEDL